MRGDRRTKTKTGRGDADRSALKRGARAIAEEEIAESTLVGQKVWDEEAGSVATVVSVRFPSVSVVVDYGDGEGVVRSLDDIETAFDMEQQIAWRQRVLLDLKS